MEKITKTNFPNLFIPGAAKSGTSTLHDLLNQHPEISMSSTKEPFHLVKDNFQFNVDKFNLKYQALFNNLENIKYKGDSSTGYMLFPNFIENSKTHLKFEKKFIFILRNPIDRIYSHYWYIKGLGSESLDFKNAILKDKNIEPTINSMLPEGKFKNYFQYGLYSKWLEKFRSNFDSKDLKIILFEDLKDNPLDTVNECLRFLNLSELSTLNPVESNKTVLLRHSYIYKNVLKITRSKFKLLKPISFLIPTRIKNNISEYIFSKTKSNKKYPKLSAEDRLWIADLYKDDVLLLKKNTTIDFSKWTDFNHYV
ncbi:MAG: hypothetical protein ACJARX_000172 [Psychroserpens sp.]|uniref:sulfotransferase family protein n=1 Tax=Psychroserpens sp. TaxID=2020870 RepID=UPI0039E22682